MENQIENTNNILEKINLILPIITLFLGAIPGYYVGIFRDRKKSSYDLKLKIYSQIIEKISGSFQKEFQSGEDVFIIMTREFASVRLIAEKKLADETRNYFSHRKEWHKYLATDTEEEKKFNRLVAISAMKIEQLMREELGKKRIFTDDEIEKHILLKI